MDADQVTRRRGVPSRFDVVDREREEHGGIKVGSAFFGWLTATGMAVLLTAIAAAAGAVFGVATDTAAGEAAEQATAQVDTVGIVGLVALLVIVLVAYYCGGYVAGRMARFDGAKQGVAVWLWAIVIAIVVAVLTAVAGAEFNVLQQLNGFPRLPVGEGDVTAAGIVALVTVLMVSLVGAVLGGVAGMRFHRQVDKTGLDR
ncbi:hypothetical protein [Nocardioides sp. Soil777]|uniref:hypothetical protein n=1 Tax=Nocardioides sp. Soil777 TaxID=1736409 RepID=UPI0009E91C4A|nr:hypothetical protein [Nocardioides sp. Soil777]